MTVDSSRLRRAGGLLATLALCALISACGSASSSSGSSGGSSATSTTAATHSTTAGAATRTSLRACLKAHGITLPGRRPGTGTTPNGTRPPGGAGPGFFFGGGTGSAGRLARNPKLAAAIKACGGRVGARRFQISRAAIEKFVACVRAHGYNMPAPNFSGHGSVFPAGIRTNSRFVAASRACLADLRPAGAPAGPPGAGPAATASS